MATYTEYHIHAMITMSAQIQLSIVLPVVSAFVTSARHSLSQAFVTSIMIFLGSNKITFTLKT